MDFLHLEIEITPDMIAAAESLAWEMLSLPEGKRFLSETDIALMLKSALEAGGFSVRLS